jgi:hypothetical protein
MSSISSESYKSDIAELERLSGLTERESVKGHIADLLSKLGKQLDRAQELEKEQELKTIERQKLEEIRKQREESLAAQGKSIPQPIGRSAASVYFITPSFLSQLFGTSVIDSIVIGESTNYLYNHRICLGPV